VEDILIIYSSECINIHNTLQELNTVHPKLKFTLETETRNKINYLDIIINKQHDKLKFGIYRKPTTTDTIIHNNSCHPNEHKISAINYLINRMNTYQLTPENKALENVIINEIPIMAINTRPRIKNIYTIQLIHHKKPIMAQTLGSSPNYSVTPI
jgi:hypothetical protein